MKVVRPPHSLWSPYEHAKYAWTTSTANKTEAMAVRQGGCLHPQLRNFVRAELAKKEQDIPDVLRKYWTVLVNETPRDHGRLLWATEQYNVASSSDEKSAIARLLVEQLRPRLVVKPGPPGYLTFTQAVLEGKRSLTPIEVCGHLDLAVGDDNGDFNRKDILNEASVLTRYAYTITGCLESAMELLSESRPQRAFSAFEIPSIAPHPQNRNRGRDQWTVLVRLAREAYTQLSVADRRGADVLLRRWCHLPDQMFTRLALDAITEDDKADIRLVRSLLLSKRAEGLWSRDLHRETLRFLRKAGQRLPRDLRRDVVAAIRKGPPRHGRDAAYARRQSDLRLRKLVQAGALRGGGKATHLLSNSTGEDEHRDEFLVWIGDGSWRAADDHVATDQRPVSVTDLRDLLRDKKVDADELEGLILDDQAKVVSALGLLATDAQWPTEYWQRLLWTIGTLRGKGKLQPDTNREVARLLVDSPPELLSGIAPAVAGFIEHIAKDWGTEDESEIQSLWNMAWRHAPSNTETSDTEPLTQALNSATGNLAEAALHRVAKYEPEQGEGIPDRTKDYMRQIVESPKGGLGRVILATRLHYLFYVDPDWTKSALLPLFDPDTSAEADDLWAAFGWSPRVGPNLLAAFKTSFVKALTRYESLGRRESNLINLFIAISLDAPGVFSDADVGTVVAALPTAGLVVLLHGLANRFTGTADERGDEWSRKIGPWLRKYWPKPVFRNTHDTTEALISLLLETGTAFPAASKESLDSMTPIKRGLYAIGKSEMLTRHPKEIYEMLKKVVDSKVLEEWVTGSLRQVLERIQAAVPTIASEPDFLKLKRVAAGT